jgi:hypothetical protein
MLHSVLVSMAMIRRQRAGATIGALRDPEEDPEPELEPAR